MDAMEIKCLISGGTPIKSLAENTALTLLNNQVTAVYIKVGLHRQMSQDRFNEEVKFCAAQLYREILTDKKYSTLRDKEIPYLLSEGVKGRLGADKDIVVTFKSLLRWIEGYVNHQSRKEAARLYDEEREPAPIALPKREWRDSDSERIISKAYAEYKEYKARLTNQKKEVGRTLPTGCRAIGDLMSEAMDAPNSLADYGKLRTSWLVSQGYAKEGESLASVFERALSNGDKFIKVV